MASPRVTIAGAGPSGLAAAIALARGGRPVTVLERAGTVGAKFIDGFQIVENYTSQQDALDDLRRGGIEPDFVLTPGHDVTYYDARLRPFEARSRDPFGYLVKRGPGPDTLDTSLLNQAVDAGAEVLFERAAEADEVDIVATGPRDATGVAREIVFKTDLPDGLRVLLDSAISRDGFAYLFVIGGQATLGVAVLSDFGSLGKKTEAVTRRFQQLGPFDVIDPVVKSSYVNFFLPSRAASAGGPIRVGEAAGFQDFLFGIGIRRAITSGLLAAAEILEGVDYRAAAHSDIVRLMDTSILNRLFYEMAGRVGFRPFLSAVGRFDFRRLGLFLTRPGPLKSLAARLVRAAWKNRGDCRHGPECGWCRKAG